MKNNGFWISDKVWQIQDISNIEKLLLARILNLHEAGSCFASNAYFADFLSLSTKRIGELLSKLEKSGFISRNFNNGGKRIIIPRIRDGYFSVAKIQDGAPENPVGDTRNSATPLPESRYHNKKYNKEFNNKNNISPFFKNFNSKKNKNEEYDISKMDYSGKI